MSLNESEPLIRKLADGLPSSRFNKTESDSGLLDPKIHLFESVVRSVWRHSQKDTSLLIDHDTGNNWHGARPVLAEMLKTLKFGNQADGGKTKQRSYLDLFVDIRKLGRVTPKVILVVFCSNSDAQFSSGNNFCGVKPLIGVHYN